MHLETPLRPPTDNYRPALLPICLFVFFLMFFWWLPSSDYTAVDGALRALGVYHDPSFLFHGNNHLLYPFWVSTWNKLAQAVGISASNGFEFMRISQAMNAFFGAAAIAIMCSILQLFAESELAVLSSAGFGFSTALLLHATNSAEPIPGLFFSLLGVRVLMEGLRRENRWILGAAGICFATALASYQAMGTVAGIGVFACVWWASSRNEGRVALRVVASLFWVTLGGLIAVCGIYGFAYSHQGIAISRMPRQFFSLGGGPEVYSGFTISRIVNVPFGLLRNLFSDVPPGYHGIRALLRDPHRAFWIPAVLAGLIVVGLIAWLASRALWRSARKWPGSVVLAGIVAVAMLCFPLLYWDPGYDKLWLLPLAAFAAVAAFAFRPGLLGTGERKILTTLLILVLAAEIGVNVPDVFRSHFGATPHLADARDLNALITPRDWVVLDFDDVSGLWLSFWGQDAHTLMLPSSTATDAKEWLDSAKRARQQSGARIVFVGVLDHDPKAWNDFLGAKVGIPYGLLDEYRAHPTILKTYADQTGTITVKAFQ